jgi:hypothetical protein
MNTEMRTAWVALLIALGIVSGSHASDGAEESANIEVTLLAHHWPSATFSLTHSGLRNVFIARVDSGDGGVDEGQVILLEYFHNSSHPPRIDELLSQSGTWRVTVARKTECDADTADLVSMATVDADTGKQLAPLPALQLLPGGLGVAIPGATRLRCYTFEPADLTKSTKAP